MLLTNETLIALHRNGHFFTEHLDMSFLFRFFSFDTSLRTRPLETCTL